jgi:hypothetical protein
MKKRKLNERYNYRVHYNTNLIKDTIIDQPLVDSVVIAIERSWNYLMLELIHEPDVTDGEREKNNYCMNFF